MNNQFINVNNLSCGYRSFSLNNINIGIAKKEIVGILGPNGAGKTTLVKAIANTIKPKRGEVLLNGINIQKIERKKLARDVAVVKPHFFPQEISVADYVLLGRIPYYKPFQFFETKKDFDLVKEVLALTDTLKIKDKLLSQVSEGERQLVFIARALAQNPSLLILDEPTSHLDINHQAQILNLLKKLSLENDIAIIVVLHDLNLASQYCDRMVFLKQGNVFKVGTPREVLTTELIGQIYGASVYVGQHPVSQKPYVFSLP